jgi:CheY-like chemotaxis protein
MDSRSVLIVDDDPLFTDLYRQVFESHGYEVAVAVSGEDTLVKLKEGRRPPDVILLDMAMPGSGGLEVVRQLKEDPVWEQFRTVPIILVTGLARLSGADDVATALSLGAVECLVKGEYGPEELVKKVEDVLFKVAVGKNVRKRP